MSGRGLKEAIELGVDVARCGGGHSGRGGSWRIFSFCVCVISLSFTISLSLSFVTPMWRRCKKAFMARIVGAGG